jgi:hypothetical protein
VAVRVAAVKEPIQVRLMVLTQQLPQVQVAAVAVEILLLHTTDITAQVVLLSFDT